MVSYCVEEFKRKHKLDFSGNRRALRTLNACEMAKRRPSFTFATDTEIDRFDQSNDLYLTITRAKFESLNMDFFNKCIEPEKKCLQDAEMDKNSVHDVLVGGSSRIPKVQQLLQNFFNGKELCKGINLDEAVAYGAAVQAAALSGKGSEKLEASRLHSRVCHTFVAWHGERDRTFHGSFIHRNSRIPVSMNRVSTTICDDQSSGRVAIYEGESTKAEDNYILGKLILDDIPPSPKGVPKIKIFFGSDDDGILSVSAEDISTGRKKVRIESDRRTNYERIEKWCNLLNSEG